MVQGWPAEQVAALTMVVDRVTGEAWRALRREDISAILLKGPAIARWLYDPSEPRGYGDADLLVDPRRVGDARRALADLGFRAWPSAIPGDRPGASEAWWRPRDRATVDLHTTLPGARVPPEAAWEILREHAEPMEVAGVRLQVLSAPARAVHVALHAIHPGTDHVKPLEDVTRAVARLPTGTWERAAAIAGRLDALPAFAAGLRLAPEGGHLADRLGLPRSVPPDMLLRARGAPRGALTLDWLATQPGARAKLALVGRKVVPPPSFMRTWSRVARRGPGGLALAYLWRIPWLAWRSGPAVAAWIRVRSPRGGGERS
ncbi:MAG: nucleotidyltransferase family protein [Actinomycetota bacterium]